MIRTGYATIVQAQTTGDPDTALASIAWQSKRTTAGDLIYQAARLVEAPFICAMDTSTGKLYFTVDGTVGDALLAAVPESPASVTFRPQAGQTGIALKWEIVGSDNFGCDVTEITSGQRRSLQTLINYVLANLNQTAYVPIVLVDQRAATVRFTHPQGTESPDLEAVTKANETFGFAFKERSGSQLVFEGGSRTSIDPVTSPADWAANGGLRIADGKVQMLCLENSLWYDLQLKLSNGEPTLEVYGEGIE